MSNNDPLANVLSAVRNAEQRGIKKVETKSCSVFIRKVMQILQAEGYLGESTVFVDSKGDLLTLELLGTINKTGVIKPRFAIDKDSYEKFEKRYLPAKDFGVMIVSTNQGLMTHIQAKQKGLGGRLICYCY